MQEVIDSLLSHPIGSLLGYFTVAVLGLVIFLSVFEAVTKYNCWDEIRRGNVAAAMATGGKIFGICNILRFSISSGESIYQTMLWAVIGFVLLLCAYFLFEFMTPVFSIDEEIAADNRAVGLIALLLSVSLSYVIGSAII